jgi:hypothetical protein
MPLKCEIMAEQDIREDQMTITNTVDYVRGLKGKDSVLISVLDAISNKAIVNKGHVKTDVGGVK